jgi:bile acid:Na+ symporter, BASS family
MSLVMVIVIIAQVSLFLVVMSFGLQTSLKDVTSLFRQPGKLLRGLLAMYVLVPIVAIVMVKLFALSPIIEVALLALAVSPLPPILPNKMIKAGGERSFSYGFLAAIALLSLIVIPLLLTIFDSISERGAMFSMSTVLRTLFISIGFPIIAGMLVRHFAPAFAERFAGPAGKVGMIFLLAAVLPILIALSPLMWSLVGNGTLIAIVVFAVVATAIGYFLGGPDASSRAVLTIASAARHPGIAIALASANVAEDETKLATAAVVLYAIVSAIVLAPLLKWLLAPAATEA